MLLATVEKDSQTQITVDLENQVVECNGRQEQFEINPYKKSCMINGYDDIDYLLSLKEEIKQFEAELT